MYYYCKCAKFKKALNSTNFGRNCAEVQFSSLEQNVLCLNLDCAGFKYGCFERNALKKIRRVEKVKSVYKFW
jgi:hypothetical protein